MRSGKALFLENAIFNTNTKYNLGINIKSQIFLNITLIFPVILVFRGRLGNKDRKSLNNSWDYKTMNTWSSVSLYSFLSKYKKIKKE